MRFLRLAFWLSGFAGYLLLCWLLTSGSMLSIPLPLFGWSILAWGGVAIGLAVLRSDRMRIPSRPVALARFLWLNLGAMLLAVAVPAEERFIFFLAPMLAMIYFASRMNVRDLLIVAGATWLMYTLCVGVLLLLQGGARLASEALVHGAFSLLLLAIMGCAFEVTSMRQRLLRQREGLQQNLDRLRIAALQDELTGVFNRRFIMEVLAREIAFVDRERSPLTVCFCDLDHFKKVNDQFGHARGDAALKDFASLAVSLVRSVDYVARMGGEEFLLVLVGADAQRARAVAERLCGRTRELDSRDGLARVPLTVSCGVTEYRAGEGIAALLDRADSALYSAKRRGRDQVVVV